LYYASLCGREEVVDYLLDSGARVSEPMILCALTDKIRGRLKGIIKTDKSAKKKPVIAASQNSQKSKKKLLISKEDLFSLNNKILGEVKTVGEANLQLCTLALTKGADPSVIDLFHFGTPAIFYAKQNNHIQIADLLCRKGAKMLFLHLRDACNKQTYFSDIIFQCSDGINAYGHKLIIKSRSPVLWEYCEKNHTKADKETCQSTNAQDVIIVPVQAPSPVFSKFLLFLYGSFLFEQEWKEITDAQILPQLNSLSTLYAVPRLGQQCEARIVNKSESEEIPKYDLPQDSLKGFLNNPEFSDKVYIVEGRELRAHKFLMCARSEYFRGSFLSGMKEAIEPVTDLTETGITYETFATVLEFIYTDNIPNDTSAELALDVLVAANQYMLQRLKMICEDRIMNNAELDLENCVDVYEYAQLHGAMKLRKHAMDYIIKNVENLRIKYPTKFVNIDRFLMEKIMKSVKPETAQIYEMFLKIYQQSTPAPAPSQAPTNPENDNNNSSPAEVQSLRQKKKNKQKKKKH